MAQEGMFMPVMSQLLPLHRTRMTVHTPCPVLACGSTGSLGTRVWMRDVSQCWCVVAQAHHVPASLLGGKSTPACLPAVPYNALCHVVVWPLLFAHLCVPAA